MTKKQPTKVLILAAPGMVRDSLCSLITSYPNVIIVAALSPGNDLPRNGSEVHPDMIIMDFNPKFDNLKLFREIKPVYPQSKLIVITDNIKQKQLVYRYGADDVLLRGCPGQEFKAIVQKYIIQDQILAPSQAPVE